MSDFIYNAFSKQLHEETAKYIVGEKTAQDLCQNVIKASKILKDSEDYEKSITDFADIVYFTFQDLHIHTAESYAILDVIQPHNVTMDILSRDMKDNGIAPEDFEVASAKLFDDIDYDVSISAYDLMIAEDEMKSINLWQEREMELAKRENDDIRLMIASESKNEKVLALLADDDNYRVRLNVANNPNTPAVVLDKIANMQEDKYSRQIRLTDAAKKSLDLLEKGMMDLEKYIDHKTYLQSYTEEKRQMFEDYLIKTELDEWKALYSDEKDGHTLTVENIKKFTDKAWQLWNSYSDDEIAKRFDKNGAGCEDVDPSLVDWEGLIEHIKSGKPGTYNLHQYADYGCIFLELGKGGLSVSCPFPSGCLSEHLEEDLNNKKFTIGFINNAIAEIERDRNNGIVFEWDQEGCIDNTITELEHDDV